MIIITIETAFNLLSISISNSKNIIYKEIYGDNISSNNILSFINTSIYKHRINPKRINLIILGKNLSKLTSIKIMFSVLQTISIISSIPIFIIDSIKAFIIKQNKLNTYTSKNYFIILLNESSVTNKYLCNVYYFIKKRLHLILQNKLLTKEKITANNITYYINTPLPKEGNETHTTIISKAIYLDFFFRKNLIFNKYILPDSSSISYIHKINYSKYF